MKPQTENDGLTIRKIQDKDAKPNKENVDMGKMGEQHFCRFCRTIEKLLVTDNIKFDLLVAVGNSGSVVGEFAVMLYEYLGLKPPPILHLPFFRFPPGHEDDMNHLFDASYYLPDVMRQVENFPKIEAVLFVDDELGRGITALSIFRLINEAQAILKRDKIKKYHIVAEDQGFKAPNDCPEIVFAPFAIEKEGFFNVIFYATPSELEAPIIKVLGDDDVFAFHKRCNLLLGLPVKDFNKGKPVLTDKFLPVIQEKIPHFEKMQREYKNFIKQSIKNCLGGRRSKSSPKR